LRKCLIRLSLTNHREWTFSSVKSSSFFHKFLEILFGETDFPWTAQAILSGFFWFDVRWQKYLLPNLKFGQNILLLLGSLTDIHCFDAFCLHGASKIVLIVQFGNQLRHYWPNKKGFLDISLFFIYSYWYLPLKEWHTTCKKEKKNPKNTKEIPQWSFLLLLFVHKKNLKYTESQKRKN